MSPAGIHIREWPQLKNPLLIAGFDGWGNALNISVGMAAYLIRVLDARHFAALDADTFYRYDDHRPLVGIDGGILKTIAAPGGSFYAVRSVEAQNDLVILKADEPNLRWVQFMDDLFSLCRTLGIKKIITLGSMYDSVLHTDSIFSGVASSADLMSQLKPHHINPITYHGPSAIHSMIQSEGPKRDVECISFWSHCPYYLQGTTHFGILARLGSLLSILGNFQLDTRELEASWEQLRAQIQKLIDSNSELQSLVDKLQKEKVKGSTAGLKATLKGDEKVINLKDFLDPK
jgi:proteasome assembly chaperone (PAC2) family protein